MDNFHYKHYADLLYLLDSIQDYAIIKGYIKNYSIPNYNLVADLWKQAVTLSTQEIKRPGETIECFQLYSEQSNQIETVSIIPSHVNIGNTKYFNHKGWFILLFLYHLSLTKEQIDDILQAYFQSQFN